MKKHVFDSTELERAYDKLSEESGRILDSIASNAKMKKSELNYFRGYYKATVELMEFMVNLDIEQLKRQQLNG